jgi:radical SAM enzyme (TIGR01210 family)
MTKGCSWDELGGCTMCNHGRGYELDEGKTISAVKEGLAGLPPNIAELFLLASGSLFDTCEVSPTVRREIYKLVDKYPVDYFGLETRAESVTKAELSLLKEMVDKSIGIEMGLESADPWIREFCVNKGNTLEDFISASAIIKEYNFECMANITLGNAFLTSDEALDDAVRSTKWALDNGADTVVLFPIHVKPYTLLEWLYNKGYYKPPTLWLFIEALYQIGSERISRVDISWYKSGYSDDRKIIASPDSCYECSPAVYTLLDEFRKQRSFDVVERLRNLECTCKQRPSGFMQDTQPLKVRVLDIYGVLAKDFGLTDWFNENYANIKNIMEGVPCYI